MRRLSFAIVLLTAIAALASAHPALADSAPIFILRHTQSGYQVDTYDLAAGEKITLTQQTHPGLIDLILPVGPGGSGSMAQTAVTSGIEVSFDGRSIAASAQSAAGVRDLPPRKLADLRNYDTHVSVTGPDGSNAAFVVRGYSRALEDHTGPIMDMFRGMIPMNDGDYSIFLNTASNRRAYELTGEIPVTFSGRYIFVEGETPGGRKGLFAVDIGASVNLLVEAFLPDDVEVSEVYMMEYTGGTSRKLKYTPGGGTGVVETIVGQTTMASLKLGDLSYENVRFDVIKELPELHGRKIDGIVGLDLLKAARYLTLVYDAPDGDKARVIISNDPPAESPAITLPFVSIRELMYVRGQINNRDVSFVLDSGAPTCMLTPKDADLLGVTLKSAKDLTYRGGGGQEESGQVGTMEAISLDGRRFEDIPCVIGDLFVLSMFSKGQCGGIMGNAFLSRFSAVTLDFDAQELRLTL